MNNSPKYSLQEKNHLFNTIQQFVNDKRLSAQNMVDLHDILTKDKPSYSHNKNGTLYMSSKYSDDTCCNIEEFINWVEKRENMHLTQITETTGVLIFNNNNPSMTDQKEKLLEFGEHKLFKNTVIRNNDNIRFKFIKFEDVTKKNEVFKRLTKKSKKTSSIPIDHREKQITSYAQSLNSTPTHRSYQINAFDNEDEFAQTDDEKISSDSEEENLSEEEKFYDIDDEEDIIDDDIDDDIDDILSEDE